MCRDAIFSRAAKVCSGGSEAAADHLGARWRVREAPEGGGPVHRSAVCGEKHNRTCCAMQPQRSLPLLNLCPGLWTINLMCDRPAVALHKEMISISRRSCLNAD